MQPIFGPDFFSANRDHLRQAVGNDMPIIIAGNGVMQHSGDEQAPFHQDSNFWYLTGLNGADLTLVMLAQESYVIVPSLSAVREAFDGAHDLEAYAASSGITSFMPERAGWQRLRTSIPAVKVVGTLDALPPYLKAYGLYTLPFRRRLITRLKRLNPNLTLQDIRPHLATLRAIKQPEELKALQRAINITTESLNELIQTEAFRSTTHEYQLEAALGYGFRRRGADGHAFMPVVGAGRHSTTLHHTENNGPVQPQDLIVLDVGAAADHYCADITRTVSRRPMTGRAAEVFQAVARVQDYALSLIRPGVFYKHYEAAVEQYMGEQLVALGLLQTPDHSSIRRYYPHATSHFLGLDTHDVGDYRQPWQANMVITCEPGIYIPEEGIGVRIEDDVLITADGHKVMSAACPRQLTPVQ